MLTNDDTCFACGRKNPSGLMLDFSYSADGKKASTDFALDGTYQGWQGVIHGGIIMTILDETMAKAAVKSGFTVLTGEITARFKHPAKVMERLRCEAEVEAVKKKIVYARAAVYGESGATVAQATAKMVIVSGA